MRSEPEIREFKEALTEKEKTEATNERKSEGLFIGCDLGAEHDYTTAVAVERIKTTLFDKWQPAPASARVELNNPMSELEPTFATDITFVVRRIDRLRLGTSYADVTRFLLNLVNLPGVKELHPVIVLDRTGLGAPVMDYIEEGGVRDIIGVTTTGGQTITEDGNLWHVPKSEIVAMMKSCLGRGILKIAGGIENGELLRQETKEFMIKRTDAGNIKWEAPQGQHDDVLFGAMLGLWAATRHEDIPLIAPTELRKTYGDTSMRRSGRVSRGAYSMENKGQYGYY